MQYNYISDEFALEPTTCPKTQGGRFYIGEAKEGKRRYEINILMGAGHYSLVFVPEWVQKALNSGKYVRVKIMGIKYDKQTGDYIAFLQGNAYDYPPFRWVENKVSVERNKSEMYEVWVQDGPKPKYKYETIKEFAHNGRWWVNAPEWVKNTPNFENKVREYRLQELAIKLSKREKIKFELRDIVVNCKFNDNIVNIEKALCYRVEKTRYLVDYSKKPNMIKTDKDPCIERGMIINGEVGEFNTNDVFERKEFVSSSEYQYRKFVGSDIINSNYTDNNYADFVCDVITYRYWPKAAFKKFFKDGYCEKTFNENHRRK